MGGVLLNCATHIVKVRKVLPGAIEQLWSMAVVHHGDTRIPLDVSISFISSVLGGIHSL